jgi:hypothetical protein
MADKLVNTIVIQPWTILNTALPSAPLTGMTAPADVTFYLHREVPGTGTLVAAIETVTLTEIGNTGHYYITWTPENTGIYSLQLQETNAGSLQRWMDFPEFTILPAGAVFTPVFTNAFCSEADVERWSQLDFTATSKPTTNEVAAFAEARASEIMSILIPHGYTGTPTTIVAGSIEEDLLREANAIGAAADSVIAKFMNEAPNKSEMGEALLTEYNTRMERVVEYVKRSLGAHSVRTHISAGEVTLPSPTVIEDGTFGITADEEF